MPDYPFQTDFQFQFPYIDATGTPQVSSVMELIPVSSGEGLDSSLGPHMVFKAMMVLQLYQEFFMKPYYATATTFTVTAPGNIDIS